MLQYAAFIFSIKNLTKKNMVSPNLFYFKNKTNEYVSEAKETKKMNNLCSRLNAD